MFLGFVGSFKLFPAVSVFIIFSGIIWYWFFGTRILYIVGCLYNPNISSDIPNPPGDVPGFVK
jgi:hypothetical protein